MTLAHKQDLETGNLDFKCEHNFSRTYSFKESRVSLARIRHTAKQNNSQALTLTRLDPYRDQMYTNTVKSDHKLITTPETHTATQQQEKHYQRQKNKKISTRKSRIRELFGFNLPTHIPWAAYCGIKNE